MYKNQKNKTGVTLIELLISLSLIVIIGVTIVTVFATGYKAISRGLNYFGPKTDVLIALERLEKDLRNTFRWTGIDFVGTSSQITFSGIVDSSKINASQNLVLGTISYFSNLRGKTLLREDAPYPQGLTNSETTAEELANVENIQFSFFSVDKETQQAIWINDWNEGIPLAVRVSVTFRENEENVEIVRTILLHS